MDKPEARDDADSFLNRKPNDPGGENRIYGKNEIDEEIRRELDRVFGK